MNKKKIIFYIPNISGGGTEKFFTQLAYFLSKRGKYAVTFFYSIGEIKNEKESKSLINYHKTNSRKTILAIFEVIIFSWKNNSSLTITAQNNPNVFLSLFRFLLPKNNRLIISERSFTYLALKDASFISREVISRLIPFSYKNADFIVCQTRRVGVFLIKKYNVPIEKIKVIPNFVDIKKIRKFANKKIIKFKFKYIISVGRLHTQKGYKYLLKAFSMIIDQIPHKLVIVGEGPLKSQLEEQIKLLNLESKVILMGYVQNPYPLIKNADLFILSSLYEGMPNVLLEAIALGVPIISSDCPTGPKEILGKNFIDLMYKPKDTLVLSKLIIRQINFPKIVKNTNFDKNFSVKNVFDNFDSLISKCF